MLGEGGITLAEVEEVVARFLAREDRRVDPKRLRIVIDCLEGEFSAETRASQLGGDHLADGSAGVVTWLSRLCGMAATAIADRLCVGKELESLPRIAEALRTGGISYQSASLLCHLRDQLGEKRELFVEDEMLEHARNFSVGQLRYLCRYARHVADPDGFFNEAEADFTRRRLHISRWVMACMPSMASSILSPAPRCGRHLSHWPSGSVLMTLGATSSA